MIEYHIDYSVLSDLARDSEHVLFAAYVDDFSGHHFVDLKQARREHNWPLIMSGMREFLSHKQSTVNA